MECKRQSNCLYHCVYHLVLVTRYRRKIFNNGVFNYMKATLKELAEHYPEMEIVEMNHDEDHIHLMLWIPPKMPVGRAVTILKSNTAHHLKKKFPFLGEVYFDGGGIWSGGYFVSTVGINGQTIRKYIEHQGREDAGQAKLAL